MSKILKNTTVSDVPIQDTGFTVPASGQIEIDVPQYSNFANSSNVITLIADGTLVVNDGTNDLSISNGIDLLKGYQQKLATDSSLAAVTRPKTTESGWHFEPRFITFTTSLYQSLHNTSCQDMSDIGDAAMKFFKSNGDELLRSDYASDALFQAALDLYCVKTYMDWEPEYDFDIRAGVMLTGVRPSTPVWGYSLAAPDIPAQYGGSVPYLNGGLPIHLLNSYSWIPIDGITVKRVTYDGDTHQGKFRVIIEHNAGVQVDLAVSFEHYKG